MAAQMSRFQVVYLFNLMSYWILLAVSHGTVNWLVIFYQYKGEVCGGTVQSFKRFDQNSETYKVET